MALPSSGPLSMNDIAGEFGGSTPHALNEYYAGGGLVPAGTSGTYGAVPSSGTISIQNFYGTSNFVPIYIEEVFQTWLYTGNNSTNTITNGINLSANGGLVWMKGRGAFAENHNFVDTARGVTKSVSSNNSDAELTNAGAFSSFNTTGFTLGPVNAIEVNSNGRPYVSWTFRKQPKFFDIVTYTGNGASLRTINHNLGSVPGCIFLKAVSAYGDWIVQHREGPNGTVLLNSAVVDIANAANGYINQMTSTTFRVTGGYPDDTVVGAVNESGVTYVAYIFAHNAGGFGATGTDNVITCGSYAGNGSNAGPTINLGYEPQWLLYKNASSGANWGVIDNMRGWSTVPFGSYTGDQILRPNLASAEYADDLFSITSTGFQVVGTDPTNNSNGASYIYIAIRRGPMKTPTVGTSVFDPEGITFIADGQTVQTGFVTDMALAKFNGTQQWMLSDRLRNATLYPSSTAAENGLFGAAGPRPFDVQSGFKITNIGGSFALWGFRRAPGFFDVVCYTGTGSTFQTITHNLTVVPELIIVKSRSAAGDWYVYNPILTSINALAFTLNSTFTVGSGSGATSIIWVPTATTFRADFTSLDANNNGRTFVAYLFASIVGVSKVGTYTGTGALQTINCGFTGGARFVLIKQVSLTSGNWYVYDSARGISSGNDPYLLLNTTAAEVTGTNYVDTVSTGFQVTASAPADLNTNGATYLFLAIA